MEFSGGAHQERTFGKCQKILFIHTSYHKHEDKINHGTDTDGHKEHEPADRKEPV